MGGSSGAAPGPRLAPRRIVSRLAIGCAACTALLFGVAPAAWAGVGFSVVPTIPTNVQVGDTGVSATVGIVNASTPNENQDPIRLQFVDVTPSCGENTATGCPTAAPDNRDPGVLVPQGAPDGRPGVAPIGATGTGCDGVTFTVTLQDAAAGIYRFTPATPIILGPSLAGGAPATCDINFRLDTLKMPTIDADPLSPLTLETDTFAAASGRNACGTAGQPACVGQANLVGGGSGTDRTTVAKATPTILTDASDNQKLGAGSLTDQATVSGIVSPVGPQNITFRLFSDANCNNLVGSVAGGFQNPHTKPLVLNAASTGGAVTSDAFTPSALGTYTWIATYEGDVNNASIVGLCSDPTEKTTVSKATPTIATVASPNLALGAGTLTDQATVSGLVNPVTTAGAQTVTFSLYSDPNCNTLVASVAGGFQNPHTKPFTLNGAGTGGAVSSNAYTPTAAGTYTWIASYGGDTNNASVQGLCTTAIEKTTVAKATPAITTVASPGGDVGSVALTDQATVSGLINPVSTAGAQTVTFRLYSDADCNTLVASVAGGFQNPHTKPFTLNGAGTGGAVTSDAFTPTAGGTYTWIVTYNGDANNSSIAGLCTEATEKSTVTGPPPPPPPPPPPVVVPPPPTEVVAPPPPPSTVCVPPGSPGTSGTPPGGTTPGGTKVCSSGTAAISGKTQCGGTPFSVLVKGRQIERVIFVVGGKIVKVLTRPNSGNRYKLTVNPRKFGRGAHRVLARTVFTKQSGTKSRTLRTVFTLCAKKAALPAFTG